MGITLGGLLAVLLIIGLAFGTAALLFPVLIAAAIGVGFAVLYVIGAVGERDTPTRDPQTDAAPASGEGVPPQHGSGPDPAGVR
jgi:hypothetical protein